MSATSMLRPMLRPRKFSKKLIKTPQMKACPSAGLNVAPLVAPFFLVVNCTPSQIDATEVCR